MNSLEKDKRSFSECVDDAFAPETSIVCRYRNAFNFGAPDEDAEFKRSLLKTSLREGVRIFPLLTYHGVEIHILDESSLMHTGTLKSIDGCITAAKCKLKGYEKVVFESGGNTGTALTEYCRKAGIETFCFIPEENLPLLDSGVFESGQAHLISVAEAGLVKQSARLFQGLNGIRHIPEVGWRYEASRFRGCFIHEHLTEYGGYDWLVQTISAAFGPIGIYNVLNRFKSGNERIPRFLGIQQETNCPMYRAWKSENHELEASPPQSGVSGKLLTKVMYDVTPYTYGTYEDLKQLLFATQGDLATINHSEFFNLLELKFDGKDILNLLGENGVHIGTRNGEVIERTGLIALAGVVKEIAGGHISRGSRVLCCLTSGTRTGDGKAKAEYRVSDPEKLVSDYYGIIYGNNCIK
jgi:hypothetical protein